MAAETFNDIFTQDTLTQLFPKDRADLFFEALFGDASEGAYDISLEFKGFTPEQNRLRFELHLIERPGKCLACNLTYGLPEVFSRHPIININGLVGDIVNLTEGRSLRAWELGRTESAGNSLYVIPLDIALD